VEKWRTIKDVKVKKAPAPLQISHENKNKLKKAHRIRILNPFNGKNGLLLLIG
jgi:hypothetical protein